MDPITISLLLAGAGLGAKVIGGKMQRDDALANAQAQAEARNKSLAGNIEKLQGFGDTNQGIFSGNIGNYAPTAQGARLDTAQTTRADANPIHGLETTDTPIAADASPMSRSDLAKRMLAVHDAAVERAKASGRLGGYTDAWAANQINNAQAGRDIGVTNNMAEGRKALIGPEGDLAGAAATRTPSIWGQLLSGAGTLASSAAGGMSSGTAAPLPAGGGAGGSWMT